MVTDFSGAEIRKLVLSGPALREILWADSTRKVIKKVAENIARTANSDRDFARNGVSFDTTVRLRGARGGKLKRPSATVFSIDEAAPYVEGKHGVLAKALQRRQGDITAK